MTETRELPCNFDLEAADPYCTDPETAAERLRHHSWSRFAVLGDSVTAGVRGPLDGYRDESFAERLVSALASTRPGFEAVNLAVPYLTISEIREVQLEPALAFAPDAVLISAGGNDAFNPYDPDRLRTELELLLRPLAESGAEILTVGLFDLARSGLVRAEEAADMAERFDTLDRITAETTRSLGGIHIDTHHHPLAADPDIYARDRIHGNARGHAVAFAAIVDALDRPGGRDPLALP
ncbi:SGNH/GDSL hydrolase family protein [Nocardioides sp. NPDC023903]|uniref:SGNH/GDSL hydrolase family protein n=1 Tax=Nocardioides sp. NPDC023903 TaxID=3157195 RepID=UPI0033E48AFE